MKEYGETIFDILYILICFISGIYLLKNSKNKNHKIMGLSTLLLVLGDFFHLIPRMLDYFIDYDFTTFLGIGKLITSITMTIFYLLIYKLYLNVYKANENKNLSYLIYFLVFLRICLCLMPQNRWLTNDSSLLLGVIRNIPFLILGIIIIYLFYKNRKGIKSLKHIWFYVILSFAFYIPVVILASAIPIFGMFMLPKTICYVLIIMSYIKFMKEEKWVI